jgi:hypothetical protein
MKLVEIAASTCGGGPSCPTVHATDRGTIAVQGYVIDDPEALSVLELPPGEGVVEIPVALLLASAASVSRQVPK